MKVRLTRLSKGEKAGHLRTTSVEGWCVGAPEIGESFIVWNHTPLENPDNEIGVRIVTTSPVKVVRECEFDTRTGSTYRLEVLEHAS